MKTIINLKDFRVPTDKEVNLKKWPTLVEPVYKSKTEYSNRLREQVAELSALQQLHYASNRYEEVLIVRVHPEILRSQGLPAELLDEKTVWQERYRSIVDLESHLYRNGTRIIKFFLHLSKQEQRKRFLERLDDPDKNWKFSLADIEERKFWKHYRKAYEACLGATSTKDAPWYVVPADDKDNARLIISEIILDVFNGLKMAYPKPDAKRQHELRLIRQKLAK